MIRLFATVLMMGFSSAALAQNAPAPSAPPVVLELFTSQGCAFCPPADALMGQMIQQPGIIGLSCHVDYFTVRKNNLGKSFCTQRQASYNRQIGKGPRYTPQLVVNGQVELIGYETAKVSAAVMKARAAKTPRVGITATGADTFDVNLPQVSAGNDPMQLWLAVYDAPKSMAMTEGNNFGKKLTYVNVVSQMKDLGAWDGAAGPRPVQVAFDADDAGVAVFAQNMRTGKIMAAGSAAR